MIPRSQSIFHLAEEEGEARCHHQRHSHDVREGGLVVGLQIIVHDDPHQHPRQKQQRGRESASIVLKQMVRAPPPTAPRSRSRHAVSCSFLKACSLCRMELRPLKDVYMYRGDQGFCSEECRRRQIVLDEAQEREDIRKERRAGLQPHHHRGAPRRTPMIRGTPGKTLLIVA